MHFISLDACIAAGLDAFVWESGGYPVRFQERIIAWHQLKTLAATHVEDARQTAAEKAIKRKRGRR